MPEIIKHMHGVIKNPSPIWCHALAINNLFLSCLLVFVMSPPAPLLAPLAPWVHPKWGTVCRCRRATIKSLYLRWSLSVIKRQFGRKATDTIWASNKTYDLYHSRTMTCDARATNGAGYQWWINIEMLSQMGRMREKQKQDHILKSKINSLKSCVKFTAPMFAA